MNVNNTATPYHLPVNGTYKDWARNECEDFTLNGRQSLVVEAVRSALAEGLYYSDAVRTRCAEILNPSAEILEVGIKANEGGEFGMDCYYARRYLDAQKRFEAERAALQKLNPYVGQELGTIVFNDFKRNTKAKIVDVKDGGRSIRIEAKRGRYSVTMLCTALNIQHAVERAQEKGYRPAATPDVGAVGGLFATIEG